MASKRYTPFAKEYTILPHIADVKGVYYFERQKDYRSNFSRYHDILWESYYTLLRIAGRSKLYY